MASEFLKQKAAKQQNKATEEMVPDVTGSTAKASAFLQQKAQQQAQSDPSIKRTAGKASEFLQQKAKQQKQRMPKRNTRNVRGGEVGAVRSAPSAWLQEGTQVQGLTTQQRYEAAQKAYDAYVNSDEYRKNQLQKMVNQSIEATKASGISTPYAAAAQKPTLAQADDKERELRAARDYYKQLYDAEESQKIMDADLAELGTWAEEDRAALETYVNFRQNSVTSGGYAVPAQRAYSMLVEKYGKEKVNNLAESWQRNQNAKATQELMQSSEEAVKGKTGASILHSAATVPANLLGSVTGVYGTMLDLATRTGRYPTLDPNNVGNMANVYSGAVRTQVAENIAGDEYDEQGNKVSDGGAVRQALSYGYQGLMASADSLARAALGGGDKVISLGLAATGSFGQTVSEASERGATPEQAIALGVINGGLEVATEYLPLDEILKVAEGGPVSTKKLFSNIAKQAGIEVIEEEASFFGSVMAEAAVLQEKSGYRQKIAEAVAGGATYEDAMERANWKLVWEVAETAFTSAFSGGISGGVSSGAANMNHFLQQKTQRQKPTNPDAHVELADMQVEFQKETWDMCDRLAKATGRNIKLYQHYGPGSSAENGYFENGVIYVNTKSGDPVAQIVSHELTHSVEFAQEYQELSRMVLGRIEALGGDLKQLRQQKADLYAQEGHPLGSQAEVDQEIVAEYVAKNLLTNEQQIMEVAQQNRTLIEKIKAWVDKLLVAIGNKDAAERAYLTNVQNLYAKALQQTPHNAQQTAVQNAPTAVQTQEETAALDDSEKLDWNDPVQIRTWAQNMLSSGQITSEEFNGYIDLAEQIAEENAGRETFTEKKHSISSNRKYSFAGPNAKTANSQTLAEAKTLDEQGAANETIRQQTGWFKGMDGKWRFEVDDSTSRVNENVSNYMTLGELLQDAEIFEAYPDMKDIGVVFQSLPSGVYAQYNRQFDQIDVSYELKGVPEAIRDAVLHEIQHAIQNREGFTGGATVDSWNRKRKAGFDSRRGADIRKARETEMEIRRVQQEEPEFYRDMMDLNAMLPDMPRGEVDWDTLEEITEDPPEWQAFDARREELQELYGDMKVWDFMDLLYQQEKAAKNEGRSATELYWDTAGEIEARNVADRRNLTAEERKNTPPRLGDEDTVFAENSGWASAAYDPETASIKEQLANNQNELQNMEPVAKVTVPENLKDKRTAYSWAVELLKPTGYRVERQGFGTIWFEKDDINYGLNYADTPEEKAALALLPRILKRGVEIGRHGNHKLRQKETVTFAAPAEVNGTRVNMAAVVTVRNGRYYTHRIVLPDGTVFKFGAEKNNDAVREPHRGVPTKGSLANATSTASTNIVDDNAPNVKRQMSISPTVSRKNVANDLRGILSRGGDVTELRKYISQLEQGSGNAERSGRNAYQNGAGAEQSEAQRIISMAKRYGISVEEYLRRNWEQYDVDGQWNSDARKALELERQGRKYSVSETEEQTEQKTAEQIRQEMPTKARNYLQGAERKLLTELQNKLGVNKFTNRDDLKTIVEEIGDEYLTTGTVAQDKVDFLFDKAYAGGIVRDAEFYEQYKEIKNHLRNTAVTISEGDSHDIADFQDFRRRNWGALRIVKEGGLPVDSAYHELNEMAPELFPESITHPADQLVRMAEVSRSIQVVETNLNAYHGDDRENFRSWARNDFESAVAEVLGDFRQVKRYNEGKADEQEAAPTTPEEAAEYYKQLKDARRTYEKAQAKNLLTPQNEIQLGKLLRGEITLEDLDPENDYVKGITAVYEGKKEYEHLCKLLAEYKRTVRGAYREKADEYLETANAWKDKKAGIAYSRETMERNIDDIVPDKEVAKAIKQEYFEAVHVSEAEATRFKTELRNKVRGLNLSTKIKKGNLVSEAHAVQLLGEAEDNIRVLQKARGRMKTRDGKTLEEWRSVIAELWQENPGLDQGKIRSAVEEFRTIYDELFEKMNAVRIRNGYEPVNYRQGYFPHFQPGEGDGILGAFGKALNIDTQVAALPTTINGLTHTFKPGIQWFGNAQERLGFNTAYDAVEGFDKYIEGVASVIYQTENIQKLRALAGQIRYRTTEDGIRRQVDEIRARDNLSEEEKQVQINSIYEHGKYTLSNFVNELDEYTNLLANKKSKLDRTMEAMMGRKVYAVMKAWEARVALT